MPSSSLAEREGTAVLPGSTHIQPAQPVLFAHHLLAYVEMAERDRGRLHDARHRVDISPLGSGALAGAGYPLDREATAREMGFDGVTANSLDAVSDRDFVIEVVAAIALGMVHLSRLAEEITWWSNPRLGFVRVADAFSTGSSMMPNKKNPDPAELVRGRAARVIGELTGCLTMLKGLPLAYQRDLQESVAPLFDAVEVYGTSLDVMTGLIDTLSIDPERMRTAATEGYTTATAVADALVRRGIPFRAAHHIVGSLVAQAEGAGVGLEEIPDGMIGLALGASGDPAAADLAADESIGDTLRAAASLDGALASCDVIGGTAPTRVAAALEAARARLDAHATRRDPRDPVRTRRLTVLDHDLIRRAPKALLHDHLDGGLRPATVIDLAAEYGYQGLPTTDVDDLTTWFRRGADRKSLELYLETFAHTFGVMQWPDAIARVAAECAEDLAADGVVYAEVRMAPELCTEQGLTLDEAVQAMLEGFRIGTERAAAAGHQIVMKLLVTAMRQAARSVEVAECAVRWRDAGVVGFDVAGPEKGFPPTRYLDAFDYVRRENFHITIHAGESFGLPSIWEALQFAGAERLGHGVRIVDDITPRPDGSIGLGRLAAFVRDRRIPLEMCPTSNVHTGAAPSIREHPIDLLRRLRFRVTLNTDNRLMSGVSLSSEFAALDEAFAIGLGEMEWLTLNALKSAFAPFDERLRLINEVVKPGYAHLRAEQTRVVVS